MKTTFLLLCFASGSIIFCSCKNDKSKKKISSVINVEPVEEIIPITCDLIQMDFQLGESNRSMVFTYDEGLVQEGKMTTLKNDSSQILNYTHKDGNLVHFSLDIGHQRMEGSYEYSNDVLTKFTSGGVDIHLIYDSLGRIQQDSSKLKKRIYEFNSGGLPIKASVFNQFGEKIEEIEVTYDLEINPFKGKSTFVNMLEVLIGYPMANQMHNITSIQTTYLKKSKYRINGVYKKEGEIAKTIFNYEYNEYGYPIEIGVSNENEEDRMTLIYDCN
ncbi:MAG: hypothetical protein MK066_06635 [Crocinitomicaceae bacterium]|nr:hypothetical protein [Crocinitomicaceae bacterium]